MVGNDEAEVPPFPPTSYQQEPIVIHTVNVLCPVRVCVLRAGQPTERQ